MEFCAELKAEKNVRQFTPFCDTAINKAETEKGLSNIIVMRI